MKSIQEYINESNKDLELSDNKVKNKIFSFLKKFNILWKVNKVDDAITENVPNPTKYFDSSIVNKYDDVYSSSCFNGGYSLDQNTEIVFHKNNTDVTWFYFIKGNKCDLYVRIRKYYGIEDEIKKLKSFSL